MLVSSGMWLIYWAWCLFPDPSNGVMLCWWSETIKIKHLSLFLLLLLAQTPGWRSWSSSLRVIRASCWLMRGCWTGSALSADVFWRLIARCVSGSRHCLSPPCLSEDEITTLVKCWSVSGHTGSRCQLVLVLYSVKGSVIRVQCDFRCFRSDSRYYKTVTITIYRNCLFIVEYFWDWKSVVNEITDWTQWTHSVCTDFRQTESRN